MTRIKKRRGRAGCAVGKKRRCAERAEVWRELSERWERSGLKQKEFCRREGVELSAFRWWRGELKRRERKENKRRWSRAPESGEARALIPVEVIGARPAARSEDFLEIVLRGDRRIRVGATFDHRVLKEVVAVLEEVAPC